MGKAKGPKRNQVRCSTHILYHPTDVETKKQLVHASKIPVLAKKTLLPKVGRNPDDFKGHICLDCVRTVVPTFQLKGYTPRSVQNQAPGPSDVLCGFDIYQLDDSLTAIYDHIDQSCQPCDLSELDINQLDNSLTAIYDHTDHPGVLNELIIDDLGPLLLGSDHQDLPSSTSTEVESTTDPVIILSLESIRQDLEKLDSDIRALIAYELAVIERPKIRKDTLRLTKGDCRDLNTLSHVCNQDYLLSRNSVLVQFLTGLWEGNDKPNTTLIPTRSDESQGDTTAPTCAGYLPFPIEKPSDIYKIAKVAEACMGLTMQINILPFHFRELVLLYSMTRSRTALTLMSSTAPHGSYQTVRSWLDKLTQDDKSMKLPNEHGDFLCVFDNNQVLQRRWNISVDNKSTCNVITMVMFLEMEAAGKLQFHEHLKPGHWMWQGLDAEKRAYLKQGHLNNDHQKTRYKKHYHPWLSDIIQQVALEQTITNDQFKDDVDRNVAAKKHATEFKTCSKCGNTRVEKAKRKCPSCKEWIGPTQIKVPDATSESDQPKKKGNEGPIRVFFKKKNDSTYSFEYHKAGTSKTGYEHLRQHHPTKPPEVIIGDPIFVNPCSYEAIAQVFRNIGKQAGVRCYGGSREWLSVVCDGLPYVIGYQIIERTYLCDQCGVSVQGATEIESHKESHEGECQFSQEFDWLLLQPGPGHIEMNMLKTFVKFSWSIFWEDMIEIFHFKSEVAKRSALNVSDHHKGMTLARIARESFAKELVLPYVRHQLQQNSGDLSVAGFHQFTIDHVKSPNYSLMCNLILMILDSIFLYRAGLRSGDVKMIDSGRAMFCRMWSARTHPLYRQLAAYDTIMYACMPEPVLQYMNTTKSINLSGGPYCGEGADFKLEEVNRNVQHWLPSVPTNKDWQNACSNHPKLAKLRQQALKEMQLKDPKGSCSRSISNIDKEVKSFRTSIRESGFLSDPEKARPLTSYSNEPLDEELPNFAKKAAEKELIYLTNFFAHKEDDGFMKKSTIPFDEPPVFVTPQERKDYEDIKNKTITQCTKLIHEKISQINNYHMRMCFLEAFDLEVLSKKGKKKQDYLDFYELLQEFENCGLNEDEDSDDEDDIQIPEAVIEC